jgi:hypothetical protein
VWRARRGGGAAAGSLGAAVGRLGWSVIVLGVTICAEHWGIAIYCSLGKKAYRVSIYWTAHNDTLGFKVKYRACWHV